LHTYCQETLAQRSRVGVRIRVWVRGRGRDMPIQSKFPAELNHKAKKTGPRKQSREKVSKKKSREKEPIKRTDKKSREKRAEKKEPRKKSREKVYSILIYESETDNVFPCHDEQDKTRQDNTTQHNTTQHNTVNKSRLRTTNTSDICG
jgi:hypothetical protein